MKINERIGTNMASRSETVYCNLSNEFLMQSTDYQKQFCHLYSYRLAEMTNLLKPLAEKKWSTKYPIKKLCDIRDDQHETCIIIGTIYKHQIHKPSILREISEENQLAPQPPREHYASSGDKIILEDELQRVRLHGDVVPLHVATGVVCAVLGKIQEDGPFEVDEIIYYEGGPQKPLPQKPGTRQLVFISGLDQMNAYNFSQSVNLFQHWLAGNIKGENNLVRIIVAGNSVRTSAEQRTMGLHVRREEPKGTVEAVRSLDTMFAVWARTIAVDVMPGAYDPANFMLPQQPFHNCMFPQASQLTSFRGVPNPYICSIDETLIAGCSGQNVKDLLRCTELEKPLEALRWTLVWGHLAPTAPDTISCYPYLDSDPFILRDCPHIYFVGNCDTFATDLQKGSSGQVTRLICVPSFSKTRSVAVVDLNTLQCRQICFNVAIE